MQLSLVKSLSYLQEEQKHSQEVLLGPSGLVLTRGELTEIVGGASSGKTSLSLNLLSNLTGDGEICALVDSNNSFDPCSALSANVELKNLLWIKCNGEIEKAFLAADHLVQAKGFGAIWLNLGGLPEGKLRMVPKTYWYRYRTRIKGTSTLMLVTADLPVAGSASQQSFQLKHERACWSGKGRFKLLSELRIRIHSRKRFYGDPMEMHIEADHAYD